MCGIPGAEKKTLRGFKPLIRPLLLLVALAPAVAILPGCAVVQLLKPRLPAPRETGRGVVFQYYSASARQVTLAGDFNRWGGTSDGPYDPRIDPLYDDGTHGDKVAGDGVWTIEKQLSQGRYKYKFVIDSSTWITDPSNIYTVEEGGYTNSLVIVKGSGGTFAGPSVEPEKKIGKVVTYEPKIGGVDKVFIAGSFNDWNESSHGLTDEDGDGVYEIKLTLAPGSYTYKFIVDGRWESDESATRYEEDGFGGQNAVLSLFPGIEDDSPRRVPFRFLAPSGSSDVFLSGSFNNWSPDGIGMDDADGDGVFETVLLLPPGRHLYKFVADGAWLGDPAASDFEEDGFGGQNAVLMVDDRFERLATGRGDGKVLSEGIKFVPGRPFLNRVSAESMEVTFKTYLNDLEGVRLLALENGKFRSAGMTLAGDDGTFDLWRCTISTTEPEIDFLLVLEDGEASWSFGADGLVNLGDESMAADADTVLLPSVFEVSLADIPVFDTPDWVKNGIIYQVFPDRFRNGNSGNDPDFSESAYDGARMLPASGKTNNEYFHMVDDWYETSGLSLSPYRTDGKPDYFSFYGGDMEGVIEKLDYLEELGITIIYFNPVTVGKSNHKYDAGDYKTVDPHFGGNDVFREMVDAAHARGIRVIVEAVYNHCGDTHWAFTDSRDRGPDSEYYEWFEWKKWPLPTHHNYKPIDYYDCWWGFGLHPNLNFDLSRAAERENSFTNIDEAEPNMPVVNHLVETGRFWLTEMDVDGFRMDVPNEVPFWFWKLFRREMKSIKPDCYLIAELWANASDWINPDYFDATMNYKYFKEPVLSFFGHGRGSAAKFDATLAAGRSVYPTQAVQVMMNLVDSHDTKRFLTVAGGNEKRLRLAALFSMTYIGAPHIWYGDEIGMTGDSDPDCRRPFDWRWRQDGDAVKLHDYYSRLIEMRKNHGALRTGSFRTVSAKGKVYAYLREKDNERLLVVINAGTGRADATIGPDDIPGFPEETGSELTQLVSTVESEGADDEIVVKTAGEAGEATLGLPPLSGAVFLLE